MFETICQEPPQQPIASPIGARYLIYAPDTKRKHTKGGFVNSYSETEIHFVFFKEDALSFETESACRQEISRIERTKIGSRYLLRVYLWVT